MGRTLQGQSELRIQDDRPTMETKKADVAEHLEVFDHVGLLSTSLPAMLGCSSSSHPTTTHRLYGDTGNRPLFSAPSAILWPTFSAASATAWRASATLSFIV